MSAIISKYSLRNRSEKHKFRNEATRAAEYLQHVVDDFIDAIFEAPIQFKYEVIYQEFHDQWIKTCKHLKTVKPSFKVIEIDEAFFSKNYSSKLVNEKKNDTRFELVIF